MNREQEALVGGVRERAGSTGRRSEREQQTLVGGVNRELEALVGVRESRKHWQEE